MEVNAFGNSIKLHLNYIKIVGHDSSVIIKGLCAKGNILFFGQNFILWQDRPNFCKTDLL